MTDAAMVSLYSVENWKFRVSSDILHFTTAAQEHSELLINHCKGGGG